MKEFVVGELDGRDEEHIHDFFDIISFSVRFYFTFLRVSFRLLLSFDFFSFDSFSSILVYTRPRKMMKHTQIPIASSFLDVKSNKSETSRGFSVDVESINDRRRVEV